jgi:hypothetical protein
VQVVSEIASRRTVTNRAVLSITEEYPPPRAKTFTEMRLLLLMPLPPSQCPLFLWHPVELEIWHEAQVVGESRIDGRWNNDYGGSKAKVRTTWLGRDENVWIPDATCKRKRRGYIGEAKQDLGLITVGSWHASHIP